MVLPPTLLSYFVSLYAKIVAKGPSMQHLQSESGWGGPLVMKESFLRQREALDAG